MAELPKLTQKASNDAVKLAAIKDALDRTGLGANQTMRLELEASFGAILENYDGVAWTADVDDKEAEIAELKAELARPRRYDGATLTDGHEDEEPLTGEVVYHLREGRYPLVRRRNVRHRRATRQPEAVRASPVPAPLGTLVPTGERTQPVWRTFFAGAKVAQRSSVRTEGPGAWQTLVVRPATKYRATKRSGPGVRHRPASLSGSTLDPADAEARRQLELELAVALPRRTCCPDVHATNHAMLG
jgi:hypothetical protein